MQFSPVCSTNSPSNCSQTALRKSGPIGAGSKSQVAGASAVADTVELATCKPATCHKQGKEDVSLQKVVTEYQLILGNTGYI